MYLVGRFLGGRQHERQISGPRFGLVVTKRLAAQAWSSMDKGTLTLCLQILLHALEPDVSQSSRNQASKEPSALDPDKLFLP